MTDPLRPDFLEFADYAGVLRRRGWIVLALAGLGALVSVTYLAVAPARYQATADVYVTPNSANQNVVLGSKGTSTAVNMDNEAQIVESNTVAVLAARTLHSRMLPQALLGQVSVSVPANTAVLTIACSAGSPGGAAACAQAFARGYLTARHTAAADKLAFELTQEQAKAAGLESRSVTLHGQIGRLAPGSADRAQAVLELKTVSAKLDTLRRNISAINASVNTNPGYIITSAVPPSSAASPQPLLYLPSGLLAGLLAGLVAASAADRRDDRVHTVREVERLNGLPVLYSVDARRLSPPGAVAPARSAAGRGYAELAQAVAAGLGEAGHGEKGRVLLVAAGSPGPAAGVVAANLAAALARVRADVVLVCADPQDTMTPALLGVGAARGLAEVLCGTATVAEVTQQAADVSRLEVITPGRDAAAAPGQVRHDVTERLVDGLRRHARYVIICGLAGGDGADTFGLAGFADAALVVIELERTRRPELAACLRRLDRVQTPVLGAASLPEMKADRGPRRAGAGRDVAGGNGAGGGGTGRGVRLSFGRAGLRRGHRAAAGAGPARQDQGVSPGPNGSVTRSVPARSADAGRPEGASEPAGAGRSPGQARSPAGGQSQSGGAGRASAALADPGRVPPGLRPLPPSRSGQQPRREPAGPVSEPGWPQPMWGGLNPSRPGPPRSAASPSRHGPSGAEASRPELPRAGTAPSWSEPARPAGEPSWPQPMWGGLDPSRSEPPGGTADPAKSEAPRPTDQQSRSGPPPWGPTETWPLPPVPRDPGIPRDRATGTG